MILQFHRLLALVPGYLPFLSSLPGYGAAAVRSAVQILLVLVAVWMSLRPAARELAAECGLRRPAGWLILVCVAAVAPMWLVFAFAASWNPEFAVADALYLAVLSPFAEELLFRGFAFRQLYRRARMPLWLAVLVTSVLFSAGHLRGDLNIGQTVGVLVITFAGGMFFAWLFVRWNDNLWAPFLVHALMNLAWQVFEVGDSAFAGWLPAVLQATTLIVAIALTLRLGPRASRREN